MGKSKSNKKLGRPKSTEAQYRILADKLRERIQKKDWEDGTVLPSRRDLAESYDVGEQTVRLALKALRAEGLLGTHAGRRVFVKDNEGGFLFGGDTIMLVLGDRLHTFLELPEYRALRRGIEQQAGREGRPLLVAHHERFRSAIPPNLHRMPLRGILLFGPFRRKVLKQYQRLHVPVVLLNRPGLSWKMHAIRGDNIYGAEDATRRLIKLGHRRIAFVRLIHMGLREVDPHSRQRHRGYAFALNKAGLPTKLDDVFIMTSRDQPDCPALRSLFNAKPRFTAVVCVDAARARMVADAARGRGLQIPRDLSIVCFQGKEPLLPQCSGVRIDFEKMGIDAVQLLRIPRHLRKRAEAPTEWFEGKTVAPPGKR